MDKFYVFDLKVWSDFHSTKNTSKGPIDHIRHFLFEITRKPQTNRRYLLYKIRIFVLEWAFKKLVEVLAPDLKDLDRESNLPILDLWLRKSDHRANSNFILNVSEDTGSQAWNLHGAYLFALVFTQLRNLAQKWEEHMIGCYQRVRYPHLDKRKFCWWT